MFEEKVKAEIQRSDSISIIKLIDLLILHAQEENVSDIHIDPTEKHIRIRFRTDGHLQEKYLIQKKLHAEIISRIKIVSRLRTDEHRLPQDGRFRLSLKDSSYIDLRVSITPTFYGENAVLRLLRDNTNAHDLEDLGLSNKAKTILLHAIKNPYGMILATGPTGSGKTTTLYTLLKLLNTPERSIVTIEDPIEYSIQGIRQIQANNQKGLTFAQGLKTIVRQDPDIIMLGEIRDSETAHSAVNISLTGHMILSTMHTNDAPTALPRLLDMGIDPYLVASTVEIVIGQRLIRKLCPLCKRSRDASQQEHDLLKTEIIFYSVGCIECNDSGFKGRIGIYEILVLNEGIRNMVMDKSPAHAIRSYALKNNMVSMIEDGYRHANSGTTTFQEVRNAVFE
ncbi:MAG: GspE/PulE family protein [bacterium]|nr:GspE/PulE family protein [bacterium]